MLKVKKGNGRKEHRHKTNLYIKNKTEVGHLVTQGDGHGHLVWSSTIQRRWRRD